MAGESTFQSNFEKYLLDTEIVSVRQLALAKKFQRIKQGPLPILLWQLSFITLTQLGNLMDWNPQV
ncbi:MAG: DUF2949 domain-containing protein [Anaerolineae bacterium]|nr:DUF2949 domain-containing protein [Gloeobacterales cyanobacterium ES-bin-313]